jgi:prepilin signal peptidase PulO-like enzyme (type II secretory pathway)
LNKGVRSQERFLFPQIVLLGAVYLSSAAFLGDWNITTWSIVLALSGPLIWLTVVDLHFNEIPDLATLMVAGIGLGLASGNVSAVAGSAIGGLAVTMALGGAGHLAWRRTGQEWLGLGDARLQTH